MANDYGSLNGYGADARETTLAKRSQVYQATHRGDDSRLPFMNRSFISFTYGGKHIEDFNLIATVTGDRMSKNGYGAFDDTVSTYDNLDGQHYWTTHYRTNQIDFNLSTDGIDQRTLDDFFYWFKPGVTRELILSEHPNRAAMARVATPPTLSMLPFESEVEFAIEDATYKTKTTLYKGDITLSFIMDKPHWYAITNILGIQNGNRYEDKWIDDNNQTWNIFASQDALKILYEDGIPLGSMIDASMLLGNGMYANVNDDPRYMIFNESTNTGARIDSGDGTKGIIAGAIINTSGDGIDLLPQYTGPSDLGYFFYSGTAPAPTIISFTMTPMEESSYHYISSPRNKYTATGNQYNTITIESLHSQELRFTTPNIYTSYNKVISIFHDKADDQHAWEDLRSMVRDQVRHPAVRAWATAIINYMQTKVDHSDLIQYYYGDTMNELMSYFFKYQGSPYAIMPASFSFNSETGCATGYFNYRAPTSILPDTHSGWRTFGVIKQNQEEDVGDMLRSNYIIIQDRNYPEETQGKVIAWESTTSKTRQYSHSIRHDVEGGLTNLQILYKNMYL